MGVEEKACTKCTKSKPLDDYGPDKRAKDGKQSKCKACYADYQAERRKDPVKKATDTASKKRSMAKRKGYYQTKRNQNRNKQRQDPAERERWLAGQRTWRAKDGNIARGNHTRRARKLAAQVAGPVPPGTYAEVLASGPCVYCGAPATTVDHVVPLARGGHEAEYNLVPACGTCNFSKGPKLLSEWDPARVAHAAACSEKIALVLAA